MAGLFGGAVSAALLSPLDILRTRLQSADGARWHAHPFKLLANIVRTEGVLALWRGLMPTVLGVGPSRALYFWGFSVCKAHLGTEGGSSSSGRRSGLSGTALHLTAATAAGIFSNTVMSPWWVIRLRLQLQHTPIQPFWRAWLRGSRAQVKAATGTAQAAAAATASLGTSAADAGYRGVSDAALRIYREEGWLAFYRGLSASLLGVAETAIQFAIYAELKRLARPQPPTCKSGSLHGPQPPPWAQGWIPAQAHTFALSAAAKLVASALTYPHEVLRTRMREQRVLLRPVQAALASAGAAAAASLAPPSQHLKYRGLLQTTRLILAEEGVRGLYGGLGVHLLRTVPNAAILLFVVETIVGGEV